MIFLVPQMCFCHTLFLLLLFYLFETHSHIVPLELILTMRCWKWMLHVTSECWLVDMWAFKERKKNAQKAQNDYSDSFHFNYWFGFISSYVITLLSFTSPSCSRINTDLKIIYSSSNIILLHYCSSICFNLRV